MAGYLDDHAAGGHRVGDDVRLGAPGALCDGRAPLSPAAALVAAPLALLWLRCALRACLALRRPRELPPIATVGLLRPRVVVAKSVDDVLDEDARAAALSHEGAHVRHRDPLRLWLVQIVTDLQWPSPAARRRLECWLAALELGRDEEARVAGARGEDLAAAVVAVARMSKTERGAAMVGLTGTELSLSGRVRRLLESVPRDVGRRRVVLVLAVVGILLASVIVGASYGDDILRAMPLIAA